MSKTRKLIDAGYRAEQQGLPCEAPTTSERERAAWEQGWRAARHEREAQPKFYGNTNVVGLIDAMIQEINKESK